MIRKGPFKYVYYVGMPAQLFDLAADPQETRDLAREPGHAGLLADCERSLRAIVDPEAADALAKADQQARIAAFGGREAILARGNPWEAMIGWLDDGPVDDIDGVVYRHRE